MSLFIAFLLAQAAVPVAPAPQVFEAALQLTGPERGAAEKKLRADPRAATRVLSWVTRADGVFALQALMRKSMGCHLLNTFRIGTEPPANAAAALLLSLAQEDETVRLELARSGNGIDKLLAVMSVWEDEAALRRLAPQLEGVVLQNDEGQALVALRQCAMMHANRTPAAARALALSKVQNATVTRVTCTDAEGAAALAPKAVTWRGSSGDGVTATFILDAEGVVVDANDACLIALARAQQKLGKASPQLLIAVADFHTPLEAEALAELEKQLPDYAKEDRTHALRTLLGHGKALPLLSEFSEQEVRENDGLLKAAVLAGKPYAPEAVIARVSCPFGAESVALLALLKNKSLATAEATRLANTCARSRGAAMLVLLDLGAKNWADQAPQAIADPFGKNELERGLETRWSQKTRAALLQVASSNEAFRTWRDELVKRLDLMR
jgi:hypothetical protein